MYVYRFVNIKGEIIYIGRTNNFIRRVRNEHFTVNGHLSEECYRETYLVEYAEVSNLAEAKTYELYLIGKYNPKYNNQEVGVGSFSFELPKLNWVTYDMDKRTTKRGKTKKEIEGILKDLCEEIDKECELMSNFLRGKDNVKWVKKLELEEYNEYVQMVYMMERFVNGVEEIKNNKLKEYEGHD